MINTLNNLRCLSVGLLALLLIALFLPAVVIFTPDAAAQNCMNGVCSPDVQNLAPGSCPGGACGDRGLLGGLFGGKPPGGGGANGGLLGGLLSGGAGKVLMMMLIMMLMQMFSQGNNSTPQSGSVDERPPIPPSGGETFTSGPRVTSTPAFSLPPSFPSASPSASATPATTALFLVNNAFYPSQLSVKTNDPVTVYNTDSATRTVVFQRTGSSGTTTRQDVALGQTHVFRFSTAGTYQACVAPSSGTANCTSTVTVSAP